MMRTPFAPVLAILLLAAVPFTGLVGATDGTIVSYETTVPSYDGHQVPITVYRATGAGPAPTLLWGHGWSGNKGTSGGDGTFFAENGYNVVAIDFRGHGAARSTSEARVHHPGFEIRDVSAVIDFIADQSWAALDGAGDPVLGALGGSYGGGYQLLTAAYDERLDALAPEITWHDLVQSLAPNGVVRSAWVDLLYGAGNGLARVHPNIHQAYAWAMATNDLPDGSSGEVDIETWFHASSPGSYPGAIDVPTLFIQGTDDTLFNFNQAFANYQMVKATGADVRLVTHRGGHLIPGLQPGDGGHPCGDEDELVLAWYDKHLKGLDVDTGPEVALAVDRNTCVTSDAFPAILQGTLPVEAGALAGSPVSGLPYGEFRINGNGPNERVRAVLLEDGTGQVLAGIPRLTATVTTTVPDTIVFFALSRGDDHETVNAQVTPIRFEEAGTHALDLDLGGVGAALADGESLHLEMATWDPQFFSNGQRHIGPVSLTEVVVHVPVIG